MINQQRPTKTNFGFVRGLLVLAMMFGISVFSLASASISQAAVTDGAVDPTFKSGSGFDSVVWDSVQQADGKTIIAGSFGVYNDLQRAGIARFNTDDSWDIFFNSGTGVKGYVDVLALQPDGKIIIGGDFSDYNGIPRKNIARLNNDGSLDLSFDPGVGANNKVGTITLQSDGKILIGGFFTSYNGVARGLIARLNADGSLDTSFNPGTGLNNPRYPGVTGIAQQPDGKILISGWFSGYNGIPRNHIVRVNSDGSLDTSFSVSLGTESYIYAVTLLSNGKILIGGSFNGISGVDHSAVARLNSNGSLDNSFDVGSGANSSVMAMSLQTDGKILISGEFSSYNGITRNRIARLNPEGTLDTSFDPGIGANSIVATIKIQNDNRIVVGGFFTGYNGTANNSVVRLNSDGSLATSFSKGYTGANSIIFDIKVQNDSKILIAGGFTTYNGIARPGIARLNLDGSLDTSFNPVLTNQYGVNTIALQADGKILIVESISSGTQGSSISSLKRLNPDGSVDSSFNSGVGTNEAIWSVVIQNDGKIIIGGNFSNYNNTPQNRIVRLNNDGSLDATFNAGTGADKPVVDIVIQNDGKILIGGSFTTYNGVARQNIARLNSDGSLDTFFIPATFANPGEQIAALTLQNDGKIIISRFVINPPIIPENSIVRLNGDGSLDNSFNLGQSISASIGTIALQNDGKILIGGFASIDNGTTFSNILRLNENGSLDNSFDNGNGPNYEVLAITLQNNGKILIGGHFTSVDNYTRGHVARLENAPTTATQLTSSANPVQPGVALTFTATVMPAAATGTVTFSFNGGTTATSPLVNGVATYLTNTLPIGVYTVTATYNGDATYISSNSAIYTQKVEACSPLVVTNNQDSGKADICGTFSYALLSASSGTTITFALPQGNTINFTGSLTPTLASGVNLDGGANGVILNGNGVAGDGLRLAGQNWLTNLTIRRFTGRELVVTGSQANKFYKVKVEN